LNVIQLEEAQKDLKRVVHLANDGGPVMITYEGRIVAELHPHKENHERAEGEKTERSREEVFRLMKDLREAGPRFTAAEMDELRSTGR